MIAIKRKCAKCGEIKPREAFSIDRRNINTGLSSWCKKCKCEAVKEWQKNNKEKVYQKNVAYYAANKEKSKSHVIEWQKNHPQRTREFNRKATSKYNKTHREQKAEYLRNWRTNNQEKNEAQRVLNYAVRKGEVIQQPCAICEYTKKVVGHHEDYSKPLDVIWLCPIHHSEIHRKNILRRAI